MMEICKVMVIVMAYFKQQSLNFQSSVVETLDPGFGSVIRCFLNTL